MKAFRYFADPLCLAACLFYGFNRFWLRSHWGGSFLTGYFNDLLLIPAALPPVLWFHARLGWRSAVEYPRATEIIFHVLVWSVIAELVGPHIFRAAVGDLRDVICYAGSGLGAGTWWHRDRLYHFLFMV